MKEKLDKIFLNNMTPEMVMYTIIVSVIIGVILLFVGFYFKKKGKEWWIIISLLGIISIAINVIKLIY